MASLKWIKIVTDMFDSPKISAIESQRNADKIIVIWIKLLCLAGKINNSGILSLNGSIPYDAALIANAIHRKTGIVAGALAVFYEYGMIENINGFISVCNWAKHQSADRIEKENEYQRAYMKRYRDKQKGLTGEPNCKPNVRPLELDIEKDIDIKKESILKDAKESAVKTASATRFVKPSFEAVKTYCLENKFGMDAQRFYDYEESKGWKVGTAPMKNWQAAVRNWEKRDAEERKCGGKPKANGTKPDYKIDYLDEYMRSLNKDEGRTQ